MARRRRGSGRRVLALAFLAFVFLTVARWAREHPGTLIAAVAVLCGVCLLGIVVIVRERREWAGRRREIASTDGMSGTEFERWVARLMRRTGFRSVRVCGGADDQGADITARAPDGRLTVVQCKRFDPGRSIGSPVVHTFAGPAHGIHKAELAVLVATTGFTAPARRDADMLEVVLIDRDALAAWAADQVAPVELT